MQSVVSVKVDDVDFEAVDRSRVMIETEQTDSTESIFNRVVMEFGDELEHEDDERVILLAGEEASWREETERDGDENETLGDLGSTYEGVMLLELRIDRVEDASHGGSLSSSVRSLKGLFDRGIFGTSATLNNLLDQFLPLARKASTSKQV